MKLLSWNCQGAFRRKARPVAAFRPDIAVIAECEEPERLRFERRTPAPATVAWFGDAPARGLGVFSYTGLRFELYEGYDPAIKYCVPLRVLAPAPEPGAVALALEARAAPPITSPLHLLAVWAMPHADPRLSYVGQTHRALEAYGPFISECDTVLMGDFNSNSIWDGKHRSNTHSALVKRLEAHALVSLYHHRYGEAQGREKRPTLFMYRQRKFVFHIDYCFVPQAWLPSLAGFRVGSYAHYRRYSDHSPLFARFI
jgi:exodeoxyribonuclease-3